MAIVINGSGTVTGISVGGLPDGIVDAGTVAADVATQAEIDAKLALAGGTLTGALTGTTATFSTADNLDTLTLISTDADNNIGPCVLFYRNSASPADNDKLAELKVVARNDNSQDWNASKQRYYIDDVTDGTENSIMDWHTMTDGSETQKLGFPYAGAVDLYHNGSKKLVTTSTGVTITGSVDGADNLVEEVASGSTAALSHDGTASDAIYTITNTHSTYLVTASANSSITNAIATVSIGTSTSVMRITNMGENYNSSITGSGSNIQVTCSYGSNLTYQYRVLKLR